MNKKANELYDYNIATRLSGDMDSNKHLADVREYFLKKYGKNNYRTKFLFLEKFNFPLSSRELEEIRFLLHAEIMNVKAQRFSMGHEAWLYSVMRLIQSTKLLSTKERKKRKAVRDHNRYQKLRAEQIKGLGSKCIKCGNSDISRLEVHHIKPYLKRSRTRAKSYFSINPLEVELRCKTPCHKDTLNYRKKEVIKNDTI